VPAPGLAAPGLAAPGLAAPGLAAAAVPAAAGQPEIGAAPADMAVGAPTVPTAGVTRVGDGPPFRPRSRFRRNLIAGLTAVAVLGGCIGAAALILDKPAAHQRSSSGASHGPQTRQAAGHATATPSLSSLLDPCLVGTWKGDSEDATVTIDGAPVQFTGAGATQTYRPDGTAVFNYGKRMVYRAPLVNGNRWEQILRGRATIFWEIQDKLLLTSGVKAHGSWELIENGGYDNGGPLSLNTAPERYTCTSTTLREFPVNGGPLVLTRKQPAPQPGS